MPSPAPAGGGSLEAVAATSASNAWAVGLTDSTHKALIERWNGTVWKQVPTPTPAGGGSLAGVAATSGSNAWAVGQTGSAGRIKTLILRWNGKTWK